MFLDFVLSKTQNSSVLFLKIKKVCFLVQSSSFWILIAARSLLLPAGEGDDRVWWQAKAWLARVVPLPSRFLPLRAYGWRRCYPLALSQQSITFAHKLSKITLDKKLNPSISVLFDWLYCTNMLWTSSDAYEFLRYDVCLFDKLFDFSGVLPCCAEISARCPTCEVAFRND